MKIVEPHITVIDEINGQEIIKKLNRSARKCYQSEPKGPDENLIRNIIKSGHTSVLEHVSITFDIITSRDISHELVRHRIASYSQESTRYVKYDNVEFIKPIEIAYKPGSTEYKTWVDSCQRCESAYKRLIDNGVKPQNARSVLNNSLKTEIRVTMNIRALRNFFQLRCDKAAHPDMKRIAIPMMLVLRNRIPAVFDDILYDKEFAEKYDLEEYTKYVTFYHENVTEKPIKRKHTLLEKFENIPDEVLDAAFKISIDRNVEGVAIQLCVYTIDDLVYVYFINNMEGGLSYESDIS